MAYEKSIEFGLADDKTHASLSSLWSRCTPSKPRQYDKACERVHQAQKVHRRIAPELIDRLKKESARTN